mmetsp:Transcript_26912/g.61372  ORF Transcript_26912/g.61372 Transcript_26912/m.61372 type:complete len:84 (-) Transcript_26912:10-261(-)
MQGLDNPFNPSALSNFSRKSKVDFDFTPSWTANVVQPIRNMCFIHYFDQESPDKETSCFLNVYALLVFFHRGHYCLNSLAFNC